MAMIMVRNMAMVMDTVTDMAMEDMVMIQKSRKKQ